MARKKKILVTGAVGQVGTDLVPVLRARHGADVVVATGHRSLPSQSFLGSGPFEIVDVGDAAQLRALFERHEFGTVYHLAALLSALNEAEPHRAWRVNLESLKLVLDLAVEFSVNRVFWPRQAIVDSWPMTVDDAVARRDWQWAPRFGLKELADAMFAGIDAQKARAEQKQ